MLKQGDIVGGYKITGELGRGGMGVVYRAHDAALGRDAAIKVMLPEQAAGPGRKRFAREAAAIARCGHPGIIKVYSYGEHEGLPYMAMEYVDGSPLLAFLDMARAIHGAKDLEELKKYGYIKTPSPDDEELSYFLRPLAAPPLADPDYENHASVLMAGVADALYEAHSLGILHRDIKPSNILIGKKGLPKLADFGLAKFSDSSDITTGQPMLGTLKYMAPEAFSGGETAVASDIYALGTVLYELVTLSHPFKADNTAAFIRAVTQNRCPSPSAVNPAVSPALGVVIMKCLEKAPAARFKDARELADAIRLAARPKGLKTQIFAGIRGLLRPVERAHEEPAAGDGKPVRVTEENKREAARLVKESARLYFIDFSSPKAHNLVMDALKLDPYSTDATAMLVVLSYHMGLHSTLSKALARMRHLAKAGPDADPRLRAALLAGRMEASKDWLRNLEKYLAAGHEDAALLALCARGRLNGNDNVKAREYAGRITRLIPGARLFTWFIDAYHNSWLGDIDKYLDTTRDAILRFPGNTMLRYALAQTLMETGRLDEAETAMKEADKISGHEDFFIFLRAELAILRKEYKTACVELRKFIGAGPGDMQAYTYYRLNKLYALRGDRKEALRHLGIGRNLAPELSFKSNEELAALVQGSAESNSSFEDLPAECLAVNFTRGKQALLDNLNSARNNIGSAFSTVYIFEKDQAPRCVRTWLFFNEYQLQESLKTKIFLPALPLSSFTDGRGNILKTEFARIQANYGRYLATVSYAVPLKHLALGTMEAQLNIEGLWKERQGRMLDLRLDEPNQHIGHRCHILALPEDAEIVELSAKPGEQLVSGGWRFLVYSRFFFNGEHFRLTAKFRHKQS